MEVELHQTSGHDAAILSREKGETDYVLQGSLFADPVAFSKVVHGDHLRIPVLPYTGPREPSLHVAWGIELGAQAVDKLQQYKRTRSPSRLVLVQDTSVEGPNSVAIGIAFRFL